MPSLRPRLKRSSDKIIAGVCAGIAEFLGWRPVSIRAFFVVAVFLSAGTMGIAYLILWWMMPPPSITDAFRLHDFRDR